MTDTPIVDLSMIRDLAAGDKDVENQFIDLFIGETNRLLAEMAPQCTDGDNPLWVDAAHTIKGGASNMGAQDLYVLALQAEKTNQPTTAASERKRQYDDIARVAGEVIAYLQRVKTGEA